MNYGSVRIRLISANIHSSLEAVSKHDVIMRQLKVKDELTAEFKIDRSDVSRLNRIVQCHGDQIEIISKEGLYWGIQHLIRRPVLLVGFLIVVFLTLWLPTRVLFIQVEGNYSVPTNRIIEAAGECGIGFGVNARSVRSEKMKNALLQKIPTLQWAGINTNGCVAVIYVREKTMLEQKSYRYPVSSMVASADGYITDITVTTGSAACKVGQSVQKGQVLISAYTDCGTHVIAARAEGEVYANTNQYISAITSSNRMARGDKLRTERRFGIILGKKLVNFENWSGIWGRECDRIKLVNYMTLPGGFQLPLAIVTETVSFYETSEFTIAPEQAKVLLSNHAKQFLQSKMIAGRIDRSDEKLTTQQGVYILTCTYDCNEMICKIRTEEILQNNEQRNRTNH